MKKLFVVLSLLLIATVLLVGCGKTDNSSTTKVVPDPYKYDQKGTLQGKIMDAVSNAPIGNTNNSELKIWLIQGTDNRGPSKLVNDTNDPLCGEYAFDSIPISFDWNYNTNFKIVVVKPGYQRFEADVSLGMNYSSDSESGNIFLDNVINYIGNIYLFPDGFLAGDKSITVLDPKGEAIPGVTVGVFQDVENNVAPATYQTTINNADGSFVSRDILNPMGGLLSAMSMTTDAAGTAVFSGANLVLGGYYKVFVQPVTFKGNILSFGVTHFRELSANAPLFITLSSQSGELYATSATNQVAGTITADGRLVVTFNQPITIETTGFSASMNSTSTATFNTPNATGAVSADGLTLTITPNFFAAPVAADKGATVTYAVPTITVVSSQNQYTTFTNIFNWGKGTFLSDEVQMIAY